MRRTLILLMFALVSACGGGGGGGAQETPPGEIPAGPLSVSGTIAVSEFVAVDSDTNSLIATQVPNNSPSTAQAIPNPGSVGGYVNEANTGPFGPLLARGDFDDFYRVNLLAGQAVRLIISDHEAANPFAQDLDLLLVNLNNVLVDASAGFGPTEEIVVPVDGEYVIVVTVCAEELFADPSQINICGAGASNYQLITGQAPATTNGLRVMSDFVPNEAIAAFIEFEEDNAPVKSRAGLQSTDDAGRIKKRRSRMQRLRFASRTSGNDFVPVERRGLLRIDPAQRERIETIENVRALQRAEGVDWAEPNYIRRPMFEPNDPGYEFQWHYPFINLPTAWDTTLGDPNVIVGVIDTGILASHDDLQGQLIGGFDFVSDVGNAGDGDGRDSNPEDPGDGGSGFSSSFHGTHVAGTVGAATDNELGVAGVAPGARIMPLRALGQDGGSVFDVRAAMCYAANVSGTAGCPALPNVPANPNPVDVINLSLGGQSFSNAEQLTVNDVRAAGVIVIAAAGNDSSSVPFYPAAYDGVVAVSATNILGGLAPYSSFGSFVDVTAPGGDFSTDINGDGYADGVLSTGGDDSLLPLEFVYPFFQGTSMAAPHVAGVAALMRSVNASLMPDDFDRLLQEGALTDSSTPGQRNNSFGYGLINAQKAITAALAEPGGGEPPDPMPFLGITPQGLNFGATLDMLDFELRNLAGGDLTITSITSDAPWLTAPANNGLGAYTLAVDRTGLDDGTYSATLTVVSSINTVALPVIMQVSQVSATGDAGPLRIRLLDEETGNIRDVTTAVSNGEYVWSIVNVPEGRYRLFAFSDADNDGEVCDPGEACGAYITTDQPLVIDLVGTEVGLDFTVSFDNEAIGTNLSP